MRRLEFEVLLREAKGNHERGAAGRDCDVLQAYVPLPVRWADLRRHSEVVGHWLGEADIEVEVRATVGEFNNVRRVESDRGVVVLDDAFRSLC